MSRIHLGSPEMLHLLWLLLPLLALYLYGFHKKDSALRHFADPVLLARISATVSRPRQWWKCVLVMTAVLLVAVSLTRPAWNARPETIELKGRDIVFVLDVSRSMLAEDLKPDRLE